MFTNYLNKVRIEKAKELFTNTRLSAGEVAEKVGFTNANYFYSIFRKTTGFYPKEYKSGVR